jgi:hypothetical protein
MMTWAYEQIDTYLAGHGVGIVGPGSGQGKRNCTTGSWHCSGQARDYGQAAYGHNTLATIARQLAPYAQGVDAPIVELFYRHPDGTGWFYKNGNPIRPSSKLDLQHRDHVHCAIGEGAHLPIQEVPAVGIYIVRREDETRRIAVIDGQAMSLIGQQTLESLNEAGAVELKFDARAWDDLAARQLS